MWTSHEEMIAPPADRAIGRGEEQRVILEDDNNA